MWRWLGRVRFAYRLLALMALIAGVVIWQELDDLHAQITQANQVAEAQARCAIYIEQWVHRQVSPQSNEANNLSQALTMRSIELSKECMGRKGFY